MGAKKGEERGECAREVYMPPAQSVSINKMSFTFFNYLAFDKQAEHSVINISGDNGVATH